MKQLRRNIRILSTVLVCCFIGVGGWFGYTVYTQGSRWATTQYNARLSNARKKIQMGTITDVYGVPLAYTDEDGARRYHSDKTTRRAMSQTVGDQMSMSGTGVETTQADVLLGMSGSLIDRTWQWLNKTSYRGDNIRLTVDSELTRYIAEEFPSGKRGAVVVLNYKTGEILSMVSKPEYDPQNLGNRSDAEAEDTAYLNRALQGLYTPGSVFKIVTTAAVLENLSGITDREMVCEGRRAFGGRTVVDAGGGKNPHGTLGLQKAFTKSCNVSFASLSYELGANRMLKKAEDMGFNDNFKFRDIILYNSKFATKIDDVGELAWTGVGQGETLVTPLHMAMISASVANDGAMMEPQLIASITGVGNIQRVRTPTGVYKQVMSSSTASVIKKYMQKTVESGTGTAAQIDGYTVCGKTGTAQVSDVEGAAENAWFTGFVDDAQHPYAVAVVIEGGGSGGKAAAPLAAKALKAAIQRG